jgi:hypothetical protein
VGQVAVLGGSWLLDALALLMLVVAVASAARITAVLVAGRSGRASSSSAAVIDDAALALMTVATAGMLVPGLRTLPDTAWDAVFAVLTTWFAVRSVRAVRASSAGALAAPNCAPHLVHCAAMLYMFLALPAAPGPGGTTMARMAGPAVPNQWVPNQSVLNQSVLNQTALGQPALFHVLAVLGALVVVGYCVRDVGHLSARRYSSAGAVPVTGALLLSQASRVGCRAVMGVTMAVMLVIMT